MGKGVLTQGSWRLIPFAPMKLSHGLLHPAKFSLAVWAVKKGMATKRSRSSGAFRAQPGPT